MKGALNYFQAHMAKGDYLTQGGEYQMTWVGQGAARLGLAGDVQAEHFSRLCAGKHPVTGEKLTVREKVNRRVCFFANMSVPKDVSIACLVGGDKRIEGWWQEAVQDTVREIEATVETRVRAGGKKDENRITGNMVAAIVTHDASRALDPQLHTHLCVMNVAYDSVENRWKAVQPSNFYRYQGYFREVSYNKLAQRMKEGGYEIEPSDKIGFNIKGFPPELRKKFSKRREEILEKASELGLKSQDGLQSITSKTRAAKQNLTAAQLRDSWVKECDESYAVIQRIIEAAKERPPAYTGCSPREAMDYYHNIFALKRWPQKTYPSLIHRLTSLPFLDYQITINLEPIPVRHEITKEEKAMDRLRGDYREDGKHSIAVALKKKERKIDSLAQGFSYPFDVQYLIRVWDPTETGLQSKSAAVRNAVNNMNGAQVFETSLPTTARKLFYASWPGWTGSSYVYRNLYAEDQYLADMLPFSSTFTAHLKDAEAIYDGTNGNLVGVKTFVGGTPQHSVLIGMTGAGKSYHMDDLLTQTQLYYHYNVIIEEGLSYKKFTESLGERPILIHPDGQLTINYLDTQGLPLNQLHIATAVALVSKMIGESSDPEKQQLRQAQIGQYINQLYVDTFHEWAGRHPELMPDIQRRACAVHRWRAERMEIGSTHLEAFADLRDRMLHKLRPCGCDTAGKILLDLDGNGPKTVSCGVKPEWKRGKKCADNCVRCQRAQQMRNVSITSAGANDHCDDQHEEADESQLRANGLDRRL